MNEPPVPDKTERSSLVKPPPIVSPDGRFYWDGTQWIPFAATGPAARQIASQPPHGMGPFRLLLRVGLLGIGLIAVLVWFFKLNLSTVPVSLPFVAEHCAIRYQGANVIVQYQGPGANASCSGAGADWAPYPGEPLGSLACYGTRGSLSWRVYDTGLMLLASQVCENLASQSQ
jgi:hypothetical protein